MMNNDPISILAQIVRSGGNPMQMLQSIANQNPQAAQIMKMLNGKSPTQLKQMAENMARERGTTVEDVARSLGFTIPSNR